MTKYYTNSFSLVNLYKKPSTKTEIVTQMIYGDKFSIYRKSKKWLKIKIREDNYKGYIQNKNFPFFTKPTHKINVLKSNVYKFPNKQKKVGELPFYSKIRVLEKKSCYFTIESIQIRYVTYLPAVSLALVIFTTCPRFNPKYRATGSVICIFGNCASFNL